MKLEVKIRDYRESDWPSIQEIILRAENFGHPFLEDEKRKITIIQAFPEFGRVLVTGTPSNENLGYATLEIRWRALVIMALITHHAFLRKGVGSALITEIKKIVGELPEVNVIRVDTGDFMAYAQQFYLNNGFQVSGYVAHDLSWNNHQVHFSYPLKGINGKQGSQWPPSSPDT